MQRSRKYRALFIVVGGLVALAAGEQAGLIDDSFKVWRSSSSVEVLLVAAKDGDLVATTRIERPVTRWLPFVKFGQTVTRCVILERSAGAPTYEKILTTRTKFWAVGLCSTARYDKLVDEYAEKFRADSTKPK